MFAVIRSGGKQYKVAPNDILRIERIEARPGERIELDSVLMVATEDGVTLGVPLVEGASVAAEVVEQARADKIIVFKKKRRKTHRRRAGHRQQQTVLRVTEILTGGKTPSRAKPAPEAKDAAPKTAAKKAAPKKAAPKKAAPKKAAAKKAAAKKAPAKTDAPKTSKRTTKKTE